MKWPHLKNNLWMTAILVVIVSLWWWTERSAPEERPARSTAAAYERMEGWRLTENKDNDGDSFSLMNPATGEKAVFRLYFADAPEKRLHQYNKKRLEEQGAYFGGLSVEQTMHVGQEARDFSLTLLREQPVTVYTRWQKVYNSERHYAYVIFSDGQDLSEKLIAAGLARIHTEGAPHPDGRSTNEQLRTLRQLELSAQRKRRGAWGYAK